MENRKTIVDSFASRECDTFNSIYRDWDMFVPSQTLSRLWIRTFFLINTIASLNKFSETISQDDLLKLMIMIQELLKVSRHHIQRGDTRIYNTIDVLSSKHDWDTNKYLAHIPYKESEIKDHAGRLFSAMNFTQHAIFEATEIESPIDLHEFNILTQKIYNLAIS